MCMYKEVKYTCNHTKARYTYTWHLHKSCIKYLCIHNTGHDPQISGWKISSPLLDKGIIYLIAQLGAQDTVTSSIILKGANYIRLISRIWWKYISPISDIFRHNITCTSQKREIWPSIIKHRQLGKVALLSMNILCSLLMSRTSPF